MVAERLARPLVTRAARSLHQKSFALRSPLRVPLDVVKGLLNTGSSECSNSLHQPTNGLGITPQRPFSTSPSFLKKGGKAAREEKKFISKSEPAEDPFDLPTFDTEVAALIDRLKIELSKFRGGGKFNLENLDNLRVQPEKASSKTVKLIDLATVVPKGRIAQIIVGEKEHVKPVTSAIQSSSLNLTPQPDPTGTNPLLLVINIPPVTAEARLAVVAEVKNAGQKAVAALRDVRQKQRKKMKAVQSVGGNELFKAEKLVESKVDKGNGEIKKLVDGATKVLEAG